MRLWEKGFSPGGGANPAESFPGCNHRRRFHLQLPTGSLTFDPEAASVLRLPEPEDRRFFRAASGQAGEARNPSPAPATTPCPSPGGPVRLPASRAHREERSRHVVSDRIGLQGAGGD